MVLIGIHHKDSVHNVQSEVDAFQVIKWLEAGLIREILGFVTATREIREIRKFRVLLINCYVNLPEAAGATRIRGPGEGTWSSGGNWSSDCAKLA